MKIYNFAKKKKKHIHNFHEPLKLRHGLTAIFFIVQENSLLSFVAMYRLLTKNSLKHDDYRQNYHGRAIAQEVSRRLPTAAAPVRAQVRSCGGQSGIGVGFLRVLRYPLPFLIPPNAPH
jgi:hypothetical protein